MTTEEILASEPSRELCDTSAIEVMGWHKQRLNLAYWPLYYLLPRRKFWCLGKREVVAVDYWNPDLNIHQAFQLQERIKELGLTDQYLLELSSIVGKQSHEPEVNPFWYFANALALDRTKAAILAVRGK